MTSAAALATWVVTVLALVVLGNCLARMAPRDPRDPRAGED
jgi:hypothetical protein